jgi:hypothetical protein
MIWFFASAAQEQSADAKRLFDHHTTKLTTTYNSDGFAKRIGIFHPTKIDLSTTH